MIFKKRIRGGHRSELTMPFLFGEGNEGGGERSSPRLEVLKLEN